MFVKYLAVIIVVCSINLFNCEYVVHGQNSQLNANHNHRQQNHQHQHQHQHISGHNIFELFNKNRIANGIETADTIKSIWPNLNGDNFGSTASKQAIKVDDTAQFNVNHYHIENNTADDNSAEVAGINDDEINDDEINDDENDEKQGNFHRNSCAHCSQARVNSHSQNIRITESELTQLRIEYVKNQILKKLCLKEPPQLTSAVSLPRPIIDGTTSFYINDMDEQEERTNNRRMDEYYGRTTQKIIFPKKDNEQCRDVLNQDPSMCFSFRIPDDVNVIDVKTAELWIYKRSDQLDHHNQTFIVTEVAHWDYGRRFLKTKPIAIQETHVTNGWFKIDIAWSVKNWFQYHELTHVIHIACKTCGMDVKQSPLSVHNEHNPFIVIDTYAQQNRINRPKRHINCMPDINECCRDKLYISFAEIGWDDWIIRPLGYHAYFCRGTCTSAASITLSGSHYNSVMRKLMYQRKSNSAADKANGFKSEQQQQPEFELIPCCTATQFSSLQLFYIDSNNTATQKTLPNMVVEACGCM